MYDDQVELLTENFPALLALLQLHAKDEVKGKRPLDFDYNSSPVTAYPFMHRILWPNCHIPEQHFRRSSNKHRGSNLSDDKADTLCVKFCPNFYDTLNQQILI